MSFPFYGKMWIATKRELEDVTLCEEVMKKLDPITDRSVVHLLIGNLYARYLILCNNLSEIYDQTLQSQKRPLVEKLMLVTKQRWLEILREIQSIEMSQFVYVDDALIELSLVPQNVQFLRPFYFPRKRDFECQLLIERGPKIEQIIDEATLRIPAKFRKILTPEELEEKRKKDEITKAVNIIKIHEKAKQARIVALNIREHPSEFKPKPPKSNEIIYDFTFREDQIPMYKIKRTVYTADLYDPPLEVLDYDFYEPPNFRVNKFGQKILIPKTPKVKIELEPIVEENEAVSMHTTVSALDLRRINAARIIQRNYRLHKIKKLVIKRRKERMELYGMWSKPVDLEKPNLKKIDEENQQKRRQRKKEFDEALIKAIEDEKARILKLKSEVIMEDITDSIRAWFKEYYDAAGDFDRYPEEFEGGTILVVKGETMTTEEFIVDNKKNDAQRAKEKQMKKLEKKNQIAAEKKAKERELKAEIDRKKLEAKEGPTWNFGEKKDWKAFDSLNDTFKDIVHQWRDIDELKNWKEEPIWDWVTLDAYADVHQELRKVVDNFMRVELEILRFALAQDDDVDYVRQKPKKEKKKKKKKEKEKTIDVFGEKSLEECYEELKKMNIIRYRTGKTLNDFIGDRNYAAQVLRTLNKDPPQAYGDAKDLMQNWILGTDGAIKSLCIVGPNKCGKKFLTEAICNEMDAVIFDISPLNVTHIANMPQFLNLVMEMARKFQPSVILIDGAHKPFIKKITEEIKHENPRKLGKYLVRYVVKQLMPDDAISLIGTTNEPWNCNLASLKSCYEKFLNFPSKMDFQTAVHAWRKGLESKRIFNFDVTSLGEVTRNFTTGDILGSIEAYVDLRRRVMLSCRPLTCTELLENLIATKQPIDDKLATQFNKFAFSVDPFGDDRVQTIARVQKEIDKINEVKAKEEEARKKKAAKKV